MINLHCAICDQKEEISEFIPANFDLQCLSSKTFSARRMPDRLHYRMVECKKCGLIFSNPVLAQNKIIDLYKKSKFTYGSQTQYLKKTYGRYLKDILPGDSQKLKLLEIGCGNGFFLEEAKRIGVSEVWGIEPSAACVRQAAKQIRPKIIPDILKVGLFKPNSFDIVCCFHTLDHVIDPNKFLKIAYGLLAPKGKALFIVHDTKGLSSRLFGTRSSIFDIEHIYLFNKANFNKIFRLHNFKIISVFDVENSYPLAYWLNMSPLPMFLKQPLDKFLKFSRMDSITFSLKAGNIGIIAEK